MSKQDVTYRTKWQGPLSGYRRCHASCCHGETDLDARLHGTPHDMQAILDRHGFASGCFGERHCWVLEAMSEAYVAGVARARAGQGRG